MLSSSLWYSLWQLRCIDAAWAAELALTVTLRSYTMPVERYLASQPNCAAAITPLLGQKNSQQQCTGVN